MTEQYLELVNMPQDEREDALTNLREILWSIAPKNFLRTIVEEIAIEHDDGAQAQAKAPQWDYNGDNIDSRDFDIEIVEGLVVKAVYGLNRSRDTLLVCMKEVRFSIEDKVFVLPEEINLNIKQNTLELSSPDSSYHDFIRDMEVYTQGLVVNDSNMFIDFLFDFTDVQDYW